MLKKLYWVNCIKYVNKSSKLVESTVLNKIVIPCKFTLYSPTFSPVQFFRDKLIAVVKLGVEI